MEYLGIYILTLIFLYGWTMKRILFPLWSKVGVILLNDAEIRGGGGLITLLIELHTFIGIPYKIQKYSHEDINQYSEASIYPFDRHLTLDLFFRDTNFSFFQNENFQRLNHFYTHNFPYQKAPNVWISIPYNFIEKIFIFPWTVHLNRFQLKKETLFRVLSHITGDNTLPPGKRKHVLIELLFHWGILLIIPFVPYYIFFVFHSFRKRRDIAFSTDTFVPSAPFLGINENNVIGRKGNRYLLNSQEYILHVESYDESSVYGNGKILLRKSMQSEEHFPFVGEYRFSLEVIKSDHFTILGGSNLYFTFSPRQDFIHEIPFTFCLPHHGRMDILKQSCIQNTEIMISLDTPPFLILPETNLDHKNDHWHFSRGELRKDIHIEYSIHPDRSPIRMIYRGILNENTVQVSFQKPIRVGGIYEFIFQGSIIPYDSIEYEDNSKILIFHLLEGISYYPNTERIDVLQLRISYLEDMSGCIHYRENPRTIWFPWAKSGE